MELAATAHVSQVSRGKRGVPTQSPEPGVKMPRLSSSGSSSKDVRVLTIVNRVTRAVQAFKTTCAQIEQDPEEAARAPSTGQEDADLLVQWKDIPTAGKFRVDQPGGRETQTLHSVTSLLRLPSLRHRLFDVVEHLLIRFVSQLVPLLVVIKCLLRFSLYIFYIG